MMMNKMGKKRISRLIACTCVCALIAGCGGAAKDSGEKQQTETQTQEPQTQEPQTGEVEGESEAGTGYQVTQEVETDVKLPNQPMASCWFPEELLSWEADKDDDLAFNKSTVPLAERVEKEKLETVNATQSKEMNVVAISIMNASTSGNPSQGTNRFAANTFSYWQYIDKLVYWGGAASEGLIVPPSADVIHAAHKNGVPVLGTVFFPPATFGGKMEWLDTFLTKNENGEFPIIDKLIEVANTYGFEGWFINQETEGDEKNGLTAEHAVLMQEWIKAFKAKAPELEIMWYDSMTSEGEMDWQNALNDKNKGFMQDADGQKVADSMFLNFWWTEDKYAEQELIKSSAQKAEELGINPMDIYAGVDVQANGILTPVKWELFESKPGDYYTSLGLYCPSWTYFSSTDIDDFEGREKAFWVNKYGDPSAEVEADSSWRGISTYAVEKTVVSQYPFQSNFSTGNGYSFFIEGEKVSLMDWNDRGLSSVMPTYRWMIENEGNNKLSAGVDFANAWYGGNAIKLRGDLEAQKASILRLYAADLTLLENTIFTLKAKSGIPTQVDLVLDFTDGKTEIVKADQQTGENWSTLAYDVSAYVGQTVKRISLQFTTGEEATGQEIWLGEISIRQNEETSLPAVTGLKAGAPAFDEDQMYAGTRLTWDESAEAVSHYEIYRVNEDQSKTFLGASLSEAFYVNVLPRVDKVLNTTFEVVGVSGDGRRGEAAKTEIEWPDNSLPQAKFAASRTLAAPGEPITFASLSSANTESLKWEFPGADIGESTEESPVISYSEEGMYTVKLTAVNESGENTKEEQAYIVITNDANGELSNLSDGKACEASSYVNEKEAPAFALDGKSETKWCATGTPPHSITIDLGEVVTVSQVEIGHAEAGGESPDMNTLSYTIEVSEDNATFQEVISVTRNRLGNTSDAFAPVSARYVRLNVKKPTQGSDSAARIYDIKVLGLNKLLDSGSKTE